MRVSLARVALALCPLVLLPAVAAAFSVHIAALTRSAGHEEISRQAIVLTQDILSRSSETLGLKADPISDELIAQMTNTTRKPWGIELLKLKDQNPLVRGTYAADKPDPDKWNNPRRQRTDYGTDIYRENGFPAGQDLLAWGGARSFHFTLNEMFEATGDFTIAGTSPPPTLQQPYVYNTGSETCTYAKGRITHFANIALDKLRERAEIELGSRPRGFLEGDAKKEWDRLSEERDRLLRHALFRLGVATHVIQDSFSPSHTFRSPLGGREALDPENNPDYVNFDILDVCYYDQNLAHAEKTIKNWLSLVVFETPNDDRPGVSDQERDVIPTYLRRAEAANEGRVRPCAHGKADLDDHVWYATNVHQEILFHRDGLKELSESARAKVRESSDWRQWDRDIFFGLLRVKGETEEQTEERIRSEIRGYLEKEVREGKDRVEITGRFDEDLQSYCNLFEQKSTELSVFLCMKHEARLARVATVKFFLTVMEHVMEFKASGQEKLLSKDARGPISGKTLAQRLEQEFFSGVPDPQRPGKLYDTTLYGLDQIMPLGTMRCGTDGKSGNLRTPRYRQVAEGSFQLAGD